MSKIGEYFLIPPDEWLFKTHGDVTEGIRRANEWKVNNGSFEGADLVIEEFVRQWALRQLIDCYKYPQEWLGERIVIEEPVKMGSTTKESDISIKNAGRRTFLYIEAKNRGASEAEFIEAEKQLETYLSATHTATVGLVTSGDKVRCIRKKIDPNDFEYIPDIPEYTQKIATRTRLVREIPKLPSGSKTGLKPLSGKYEKLLYRVHSTLRDIDGLHADEALDELCKVLYAKIYDERCVTEKNEDAEFKFQVYGSSNPSEAASTIRVLYQEACTRDREIYSKRIPNYERSRGVFKKQITLSDAALYKVVEQLQEFSFIDSNTDVKGRAFQGVLSSAVRAGMGQYFTPDPIVDLAIGIMRPLVSETVLDPFCGSGHFLTRCLEYVTENQGDAVDEYLLHQFKFFHLHGIEKSDRMVRIAMTDMLLHDDGHTNIRNTDALLSFENYPDILSIKEDGNTDPAVFDLILTNPPFGSLMQTDVMGMVGRFTINGKKKTSALEILGLERCFQFLKPGGRLAIVLPSSLLQTKSTSGVRKWVYDVAQLKAVITFPEETFTPFGAMVKTCLCVFQKYPLNAVVDHSNDVYLAHVENLGFDATGRPKDGSEVQQVVKQFHEKVGWN